MLSPAGPALGLGDRLEHAPLLRRAEELHQPWSRNRLAIPPYVVTPLSDGGDHAN